MTYQAKTELTTRSTMTADIANSGHIGEERVKQNVDKD